jgi:hypothetical protein
MGFGSKNPFFDKLEYNSFHFENDHLQSFRT